MSHRSKLFALFAVLSAALLATTSHARSIRVDSGDWDASGPFINTDVTVNLGFTFNALGVSASTAQLDADGSLSMTGGESVTFNPFFDAGQTLGGREVQLSYATTNALFSQAGVEAGIRVQWLALNGPGGVGDVENFFQLSIFELTSGMFAVEFNYDQLLFGSEGTSSVGYQSTLAGAFDLIAALGFNFNDYLGVGDDFSDNCLNTPDALACNNYYNGAYGPGQSILPGTLNDFFRFIDSNGDPVQGRALFLFDGNGGTPVPAPATLVLFALGALLLRARRN